MGEVPKRSYEHRTKGDDGLLSSQILIGMSHQCSLKWPTAVDQLILKDW